MKLKHDELMLPKFAETREAIRQDTDIKIIHLHRQNLFARFVSHWLAANVTKITEIHSDADRPTLHPVELPIKECHVDFDRTSARYNFFQKMFSNHPIFQLSYEDIVGDDGANVLRDVQDFLGVEQQPLSTNLRKVIAKDLREIVLNYDELADHFANTPYGHFFET